jgi:hypothetical protein
MRATNTFDQSQSCDAPTFHPSSLQYVRQRLSIHRFHHSNPPNSDTHALPFHPPNQSHANLKLDPQLPTNLHRPRPYETPRRNNIAEHRPHHNAPVPTSRSLKYTPRNRNTRQRTETHDRIASRIVPPILVCIAQLAHANRRE